MAGASLFQVGGNVEFWRVLVHLSILAVFLLGFEAALHHLEHRLARYDKYHAMLQKVYRELMVLGLISLILKVLKEVTPIDSYNKPMIAFQVADLIIFGLAIALILQSICIFLLLRGHSSRADEAEFIMTEDLVELLQEQDNRDNVLPPLNTTSSHLPWICCSEASKIRGEMAKHRLLRQLFLHRFGLPELFPFSKYIRRAQAHQISSMIEVEPSMWVLLLVVAWGICGLSEILENIPLIQLLVVFSWILLLLELGIMCYLRACVHQLFDLAGFSKDKFVLETNLAAVADREATALESMSAHDAIETMNQVLDIHNEDEHDGDGFAATVWRKLSNSGESRESAVSTGTSIRFFSRRAWQVAVTFSMTLNGFFIALFVQCTLYNLDEIYKQLGLVAAVMVPLPMLVNALVLQQYIFSDFVLLCSVLRVDTTALEDVIRHFIETVELQSEFAASLAQCLKEGGLTTAYLEAVIQSHDLDNAGFIEIDKLRAVLASIGFNMSRFRLNSVAKLLFELQGTGIEYAQLFRLLDLVQLEHRDGVQHHKHPQPQRGAESFDSEVVESRDHSFGTRDSTSTQLLSLLAQSSVASGLGGNEFAYSSAGTPVVRRGVSLNSHGLHSNSTNEMENTRQLLKRSYSHEFAGSNARVLRDMYNLNTRD